MAFDGMILAGIRFEDFPGPRDWSPALERAKKELKTLVPKGMRVSLKEVQEAGFHDLEVKSFFGSDALVVPEVLE
jgi:hypothetical protein